ncbi:MAG: DNA-directed RNA polymerase subunit K [Candidatus Altiarchaeota archaeon]|nr:DNA-directed RNA polymerase subunit K [Candidatus Altiarchaeota archaeon]
MTHTKFEIARLIGARALQIKMGAPVLVKATKGLEKPLDMARLELEQGKLPITVKEREVKKVKREIKTIPSIVLEEEEPAAETAGTKEAVEEFDEALIVEDVE